MSVSFYIDTSHNTMWRACLLLLDMTKTDVHQLLHNGSDLDFVYVNGRLASESDPWCYQSKQSIVKTDEGNVGQCYGSIKCFMYYRNCVQSTVSSFLWSNGNPHTCTFDILKHHSQSWWEISTDVMPCDKLKYTNIQSSMFKLLALCTVNIITHLRTVNGLSWES